MKLLWRSELTPPSGTGPIDAPLNEYSSQGSSDDAETHGSYDPSENAPYNEAEDETSNTSPEETQEQPQVEKMQISTHEAPLNPKGGANGLPEFPQDLTGEERATALRRYILECLDDEKAEDIVSIELEGKSEIADVMIIASGRSARHVGAVASKVQQAFKQAGATQSKIEGQPACDWVLVDAGDIIVHLFRPEVRDFYNLERIWSEAATAPVGVEGAPTAH